VLSGLVISGVQWTISRKPSSERKLLKRCHMEYRRAIGTAVAMLVVSFASHARAQETANSLPKEGTGPARVLAAIEINGARRISSEELVDFMEYTRIGKPLNIQKLEIDLDRIRVLLYADRGFVRAHFTKPQIIDTDQGVKVILSVDEGLRYRIGEVKIEDAIVIPPDRLSNMLAVKTGDIVSGPAINCGIEEIRKVYDARGYIRFDCDVSLDWKDPAPGTDDGTADLTFSVREGVPYTIRKVTISGNTVSTDEALLRVFSIKSGAPCSREASSKGVRRLSNLDLFDEVSVFEDIDDDTRQVDITVKLTPKRSSE